MCCGEEGQRGWSARSAGDGEKMLCGRVESLAHPPAQPEALVPQLGAEALRSCSG